MPRTSSLLVMVALLSPLAGPALPAAEVERLPAETKPLLRVDPGGPAAFVTALAFSPDGKTLYAGGWDKVIRVWTKNDKGTFEASRVSYRVPVGPGIGGSLNALALSPDGDWLAAAGNGVARQTAGFHDLGFIIPSFGVRDPLMLRDMGTIYLFNTRDGSVRTLRGHRGYVTALSFGPPRGKAIPLLLSVAVEEKAGNAIAKQLTARLWDVDRGETVAVLPGLPSEAIGSRLPGVALGPAAEEGNKVRAAFALYDGSLRLWDPSPPTEQPRQIPDLASNLSVSYLDRGNRLLTTGYDKTRQQAQLAVWKISASGEPQREQSIDVGKGLARGLSLLSRRGNGTADLAAMLLWIQGGAQVYHKYNLCIVDLSGKKPRIVKELRLWEDPAARQPVVAASLRGEHLAVAGSSDQAIRVYSLRAVLDDEDKLSPQILRGEAILFRHASFIRRGKDLGLLLNRKKIGEAPPQPDVKRGDWVFDFGKRRLSDNVAGWKAAGPQASRWKTVFNKGSFTIFEGDKKLRTITVPKANFVTDYALLPPSQSVKAPLLAVAAHEYGQPLLNIYNAQSGERLRSFTGHTERLEALAFAEDGRFLVSASVDGTVCVWSLTDLDTILGKHGGLPGVTVAPADARAKAVKVLEVHNDSPVHGKLKPGDVLTGLVENKQLRRLDSPRAFYEALYQLPPGRKVSLRRGDADGDDDIAFVVGQGIDERKPLFSLLVLGGAKASDCEWIGWSPIGPYEASSPRAEKYLGWHFNTGDPKAPTRFADAGQYRKFYYRENLLDQLIQRGALGRLESPRLPAPIVEVWVEDEDRLLPQAGQETLIVRQPRVDVKVVLLERPLSSLSALTWRLDGGAEKPLDLDHPGEASFKLPMTLARGEHRIVVTARTHEELPEPVRKSLVLRYQPPRPEILHKDAGQQIFVQEADYTLHVQIKPAVAGENVRLKIRHQHDEGEEKLYTQTLTPQDIKEGIIRLKHPMKLRPGNNEAEVIAVNGGAPDGGQEPETSRLKLSVFYHFKAKPPVITFEKVAPFPKGANADPLNVTSSQSVTVHLPVVNLLGRIKSADEALTEAVWDRGKSTPAARLDRFEPGKRTDFSFEQRIELEPGKQTIRLRVRTKNSDKVEHHLLLDYQPPVPLVSRITAPNLGEVLEGSEDTKTVDVRGEVQLPPKVRAYKAVILVDGKPSAHLPVIDEKTGSLTGTAVIGPGENRIWIEVSNAWGTSSSSEVIAVRYVRPPVFVGQPSHEPVPGKALLNVKAQVRSATPLESESVRVAVNGKESPPNETPRIEESAKNLWTVRLLGVPLDASSREQKIILKLGNSEALCRTPAVFTLRSETVLPAPEVEFLDPRQDTTVSDAQATIRFQVRSKVKLERVRLLREGRPPLSIDLAGARRVGDKYELSATQEIELASGMNRLSVEVVSVGGRLPNSPQVLVTYSPPPLRIEMKQLTEQRVNGAAVAPQRKERGTLIFPKVSSGSVWLHGHISWSDEGKNWREDSFLLRVFVNGFQQIAYQVQRKAKEKRTPFQVRLILNRPTDNRIGLVPFRQEAGVSSEAVVDCTHPITAQRLHILALSPYGQPAEVKERILKAISARQKEKGSEFAFLDVNDPRILTGDRVDPEYLCGQMARFKEEIHHYQIAKDGKNPLLNEVLLIYYEGGEKIDPSGHFFETYSPSRASRYRMPCEKVVDYLADVPGAHLLLLDVDQSVQAREDRSRDRIEHWKDTYADVQPHVVVMRCARRVGADRHSQVRLIPVLQKQLPQAGRLSKLIPLIEEALASSNDRDLLVFTKYLPTELADLMIGAIP